MLRVPRAAVQATSLEVAPHLLGAVLVHESAQGRVAVRLTEVEAYAGQGEDPGSHAFRGRTPRTTVMFGPPGHLYVYFTYGMHWCANVVCGPDGSAGAVLLRAGEIVTGLPLARGRRSRPDGAPPPDRDLARGPARLTRALGLDGSHDGHDLCAGEPRIWLERPPDGAQPALDAALRTGPRVGVSGPGGDAARYPWRFWLDGEPTVSGYRPGVVRSGRATRATTASAMCRVADPSAAPD